MKTSSVTPNLQAETKPTNQTSVCDDSFQASSVGAGSFIVSLQDKSRPIFKTKASP